MRLWVALSDHSSDFRAGKDALRGASDAYKKVRNTVRFMLGVLGTDKSNNSYYHAPSMQLASHDTLKLKDMPLLEQWILHRLAQVTAEVRTAYDKNDFGTGFQLLHDFCATDLSAVYLNVRKDVFYCDAEDSDRRKAALAATTVCLDVCLSFLAPVLAFLSEEARQEHRAFAKWSVFSSVHQGGYPDMSAFVNNSVARDMEQFLALRDLANGAVEAARAAGMLTNQMHAHIVFSTNAKGTLGSMTTQSLTEFLLAASVSYVDDVEGVRYSLPELDVTATVVRAGGDECVRCRQVLHEELQGQERQLCARCDVVMEQVA
jgi:isoleucyl-tRNA synthetase